MRRKYHHTLSSTLIYALGEALAAIEEEGLEARWARHERHHRALVGGLDAMGLGCCRLPASGCGRSTRCAIPAGVDDAAVRTQLLERFNIEIGAGLGPLAGRIWRVGLMGAGSTPRACPAALSALEAGAAGQGSHDDARRRRRRRAQVSWHLRTRDAPAG